jgi:hypothetical protein
MYPGFLSVRGRPNEGGITRLWLGVALVRYGRERNLVGCDPSVTTTEARGVSARLGGR